MDDLQHDQEKDLPPQDDESQAPPPVYPPVIEQLRLIFAKGIDPHDTLRVYLRLGAIALGIYYLGTGFYGIFTN